MTPGWGNSTDLDRLMPGPVRVLNSFYGRLTHKQVKRGSHQTACGATIRHGFEETWEPDVFKDRSVAPYLCKRCFK